jgi:hypothetical protein
MIFHLFAPITCINIPVIYLTTLQVYIIGVVIQTVKRRLNDGSKDKTN